MENNGRMKVEVLRLFPTVDPDYVDYLILQVQRSIISSSPQQQTSTIQSMVIEKLSSMHNHFPNISFPTDLKLLKSSSYAQNYCINTLHEWFPLVPVKKLNDHLNDFCEVYTQSALFQLSDKLSRIMDEECMRKRTATSFLLPASTSTFLLAQKMLSKQEKRHGSSMYKSRAYIEGATQRLLNAFPSVWKYVVKSVLEENGHDYIAAYEQLEKVSDTSYWLWNKMTLLLFSQRKPQDTPEMYDEFLMLDVWILEAKLRRRQENYDHSVAKDLNWQFHAQENQLVTCECCFGDAVFEEVVGCLENCHLVCLDCLEKYMQELTYGEAASVDNLSLKIKCISSTSGECHSHYPVSLLQSRVKPELWTNFCRNIARLNLQKSETSFLVCSKCHYAEYYSIPSEPILTLFISQLLLVFRDIKVTLRDMYSKIQISFISALFLLLSIHPVILVLCLIALFSVNYVNTLRNRQSIDLIMNSTPEHPYELFRCRYCRTNTCTLCGNVADESHVCRKRSEEDELRLSIERAMTSAIIRTCPVCQTQLMKSDGCNKITCKCGYSMCYCCRQDIRQEGYNHFCRHFRAVPGDCTLCSKCDLWKSPDEEKLVQQAAEQVRREYLLKRKQQRPIKH